MQNPKTSFYCLTSFKCFCNVGNFFQVIAFFTIVHLNKIICIQLCSLIKYLQSEFKSTITLCAF